MDRLYAEWQKNYSHGNRRNAGGSVDKGRSQSGILLRLLWCLVVDIVIEGTGWEWMLYTGVCTILTVHRFFWKFVYGTAVVRQKSAINLSTEGSAPGSTFYETRSLRWNLLADTALCSKCGAAKCMNIRAANKDLVWSKCRGYCCTDPSCILFYSVLFYVYNTDTNITSLDKQSSLQTHCKHGEKLQLNCALSRLADTKRTTSCKLPTFVQNAMLKLFV